jgi:hypothetical protein
MLAARVSLDIFPLLATYSLDRCTFAANIAFELPCETFVSKLRAPCGTIGQLNNECVTGMDAQFTQQQVYQHRFVMLTTF